MTEVLEGQMIALEQLRQAPWNANRVPPALMKKIRRSIERFGFVENLVARPHPSEEGCFEVISGNHRLEILAELGVKTARVVVVDVDDAQAKLLAQTLNRTRGRDDPEAYRALINTLLEGMTAAEIAGYLPEDADALAASVGDSPNLDVPPIWGIIVDCEDELDQAAVLEEMLGEGRTCRALLT